MVNFWKHLKRPLAGIGYLDDWGDIVMVPTLMVGHTETGSWHGDMSFRVSV